MDGQYGVYNISRFLVGFLKVHHLHKSYLLFGFGSACIKVLSL